MAAIGVTRIPDKILSARVQNSTAQYLVKFIGESSAKARWIEEAEFPPSFAGLVTQYRLKAKLDTSTSGKTSTGMAGSPL